MPKRKTNYDKLYEEHKTEIDTLEYEIVKFIQAKKKNAFVVREAIIQADRKISDISKTLIFE